MTKATLNQNELRALRKLTGEPDVQSSSIQSSSLLSSSTCEAVSSMPVPATPDNGVLVKISHAGACFTEGQTRNKKYTPQFPGNEVAGTIHEVGNNLPNANFSVGDKVMIMPNEATVNTGYAEYVPVMDPSQVIQVPNKVPLEVAAMLPGDALKAYAAVNCAAPHVEKLRKVKSCVNILVVGGSSLGLWTVKLAKYMMGRNCNNVRLFVADNSIDRLLTAQDHGCYDIIHWNEEDHEQYIVERTLDSCRSGVDVIIDYVGTNRTMQRCLKVLNREGLILVGGNRPCETNISLSTLAAKQQSIVGVPRGNMNQLIELINAVAEKTLEVPAYKVYPVESASHVFEEICECRITERVIFKFGTQSSGHLVDNH
ncbi:NAD-dependent alcohol dehydrogenase [Plakobranchus ocellatus]|uniref:NAD-dependent alcohol dehydrogenase n=1 Tax=Plakobranchus ocellatus TaxID=259542 RepID=A0AAV4CT80_9GAST|nr:NAD-dependent alcohol dehydrogenase [Plakobranchus ocellatus]